VRASCESVLVFFPVLVPPCPPPAVVPCATLFRSEIAITIKRARDAAEQLAMILPVGPMGMYRWAVYFLTEWGVSCDHVHGFNMRSEEHTSVLQSRENLVCRLLREKKTRTDPNRRP